MTPWQLIPTPAGSSEAHAGARLALFYSSCTLRESFFSEGTRPAVVDVWRALLSALVPHFTAPPTQFAA